MKPGAVTSSPMTLAEFLGHLASGGLYKMAFDPLYTYLSFGNIAIGIELLGACMDSEAFNTEKQSRKRFDRGIDKFMAKVDPRYNTFNSDTSPYCLYKQLRCGMAHLIRPQGKVAFTGRDGAAGNPHLVVNTNIDKLVLVAEEFSDDFAKACRDLITQLPVLEVTYPKLKDPFIMIHQFS